MANDTVDNAGLEKSSDLGTSQQGIARRWKLALKLASKREIKWREKVKQIYEQYVPETAAPNTFNILWSNTETLRPAIYNSLPEPIVRRRYQDEDKLGKAVSQVITRALEFSQDTYDFDAVLRNDVLAVLLAGRAVSRVKYIPDIRQVGVDENNTGEEAQDSEAYEEIEWEQVVCERVQWDDLRIGEGKTWEDVNWVGFRHRINREELIEKFGEDVGKKIPLDSADDEDVRKAKGDAELFKSAEIWEIWDKEKKQIVWICPTFDKPCKIQEDVLKLQGFYPIPRPLYAIENDQSLVPAPLYIQYEQQAKELNRITVRINKLIEALKVRGIYDSTLAELNGLMKGADNELIPAVNVMALIERGGLDKAIWMMPIETAALVIKELYVQRDQTKNVIYEVTGISDIMRASSDPNETLGAQKLKANWGSQRLQRLQRETQRYIRDLVRLKAEIISEKFQQATLEQMTLVQLPHQAEVQQQMMQYQQASMMAQQQGQQPPPQPQEQVTWEQVYEAMQNDATRTYHIDIETDSTVAASQDADMQGMKDLLGGLATMIEKFTPAVQTGAMPIEVIKEFGGAVIRRAKMGSSVEDAWDKLQQPTPPPDPNAGQMQIEQQKMQMQAQISQQETQSKSQADQQSAQMSAQLEQHKQTLQAQQVAQQNQIEAQRETQRIQLEAESEARKQTFEAQMANSKLEFERWKAQLDADTRIAIAELSAQTTLQTSAMSASNDNETMNTDGTKSPNNTLQALVDASNGNFKDLIDAFTQSHTNLIETMNKPVKKNQDGSWERVTKQ